MITQAATEHGDSGRTARTRRPALRFGLLVISLGVFLPVAFGDAHPVSFGPATNYGAGLNPYSLGVGDFNRDGKPDLAVVNLQSFNVSVFLGTGDGTFGAATNFYVGYQAYSLAIGDLNGDGKLDLAVAKLGGHAISVLLGVGDGSFTYAPDVSAGAFPTSIAIGDLNGDGKLDLAVAHFTGYVSTWIGSGTGTFVRVGAFPVGVALSLAIGDFSGDGNLDVAVTNRDTDNISVLLGTGTGALGPAANYPVGDYPLSIAIGDLNGDGTPDLAVANLGTENVSILLGTGAGSFNPAANFPVPLGTGTGRVWSVAIGDLNGDGLPDLAVTDGRGTKVWVLLGTGAGAFGGATSFAVGTWPTSVAIGDFNGDSRPDLAVANEYTHNVSVLLNETVGCGGTFDIPDGDVECLIAAIHRANANVLPDTIHLAPGGTYTLTATDNADNGLPIITSPITIEGNGATIQRSSAAGTPDFRIFRVASLPGDLTLHAVTVRGARLFSSGGGIFNEGRLKVVDSFVVANRGDGGAGIYNRGSAAELIHTTVSGNSDRFFGAGIWNDGGLAVLTLTDCSISDNSGRLRGTGIYNRAGAVTLIRTTVSGNSNGAGIMNHLPGSRLTLLNSTVSGNTPHPTEGGGGILNARGALTLLNSTVTGNDDGTTGGGLNNGGGVFNEAPGTATLKNSIVANNRPADLSGVITTLGHNLIEMPGASSIIGTGTGDILGVDAMLGPLADNGGPTKTHRPLPGSLALDAVPLADCTDANLDPITTDQRGVARPQPLNGDCDIGSVEWEDTTAPDTYVTGRPPSISNSSGATFIFGSSEAGSTFECRLDGESFAACSSPANFISLADGPHTFYVRATDPAGNTDPTPAAATWTVDTTPPETVIISAVDGDGAALTGGAPTLSSSILFTFGGTDAVGVAGFECSLDGAAYAPCTSPAGYSSLALGSHIFRVRAIDSIGNIDPSPASFTWTVVTPAQATQNLIAMIDGMGLQGGVANSLSAPLGQVSKLLNDSNPTNDGAACGKLDAFINQVNAKVQNGQLASAQANQLLQAANAIKASLGC